jgi:hypothetical protein
MGDPIQHNRIHIKPKPERLHTPKLARRRSDQGFPQKG